MKCEQLANVQRYKAARKPMIKVLERKKNTSRLGPMNENQDFEEQKKSPQIQMGVLR